MPGGSPCCWAPVPLPSLPSPQGGSHPGVQLLGLVGRGAGGVDAAVTLLGVDQQRGVPMGGRQGQLLEHKGAGGNSAIRSEGYNKGERLGMRRSVSWPCCLGLMLASLHKVKFTHEATNMGKRKGGSGMGAEGVSWRDESDWSRGRCRVVIKEQ